MPSVEKMVLDGIWKYFLSSTEDFEINIYTFIFYTDICEVMMIKLLEKWPQWLNRKYLFCTNAAETTSLHPDF